MKVVALVAHPDDELMCAGTLARLVTEGHDVELVVGFFSDFGPDGQKQGLTAERLVELAASSEAIGCTLRPLVFPDETDFAWSQRWVQRIEPHVGKPDLLISHRVEDCNTSHGHLGRVARTIARKNTTSLWEMDQTIPGGLTAQAPNMLVNISHHTEAKAEAVAAYRSQLERYPGMAEAIDHRDRLLGWELGVTAAEGFTVHRAAWL